MREIVFDTETTGLDPESGHRICEIGAVELIGQMPTGRSYHQLINPMRDMPAEAAKVHGHTNEILADKPVFAAVARDFLDFIGNDSRLIAHNAQFDMNFVNHELVLAGFDKLDQGRVVDTLAIAKKKFPGARHTLDLLCTRFGIDISRRVKHGALLDAELLADVYVELMGGRQRGMDLAGPANDESAASAVLGPASSEPVWPQRTYDAAEDEKALHRAFLEKIDSPLWAKYLET